MDQLTHEEKVYVFAVLETVITDRRLRGEIMHKIGTVGIAHLRSAVAKLKPTHTA
jgi:hypothetical protein